MPGFTEVEKHILNKYISDPQLSSSLALIRRVMESIWAGDAPRIVQNYTDHGEKHSERIAYFVEKLLQVNPDMKFSEQEIYLLLAGVYLHDIGMQYNIVKYPEVKEKAEELGAKFDEAFTKKTTDGYSLEEQNEIRKNHHFLSAAWIDCLHRGNDPVLSPKIKSIPYDLVDDLMDVCKFHSKLPINDCSDYFNDYPNSRKKMVASLLRFADELDISSTRVNIETVKIFSVNPENSVYWWLHNYTKVDFVGSNKVLLKVNLHPEDFELYGSFILEDYIANFRDKNKSVLDVLVEQKIPILIDNNSDIVAHTRVEKFPPEITVVLDEKMQEKGLSCNSIIPSISKDSSSSPEQILPSQPEQESKATISNVPYSRNTRFTGREDKLIQIHEALISGNTVAVSQPVAVCGLGGIGKTQVAVEYTYLYSDEYEFIFWVKADSEDTIVSSYTEIAKLLNLPVKNDSDLNNIVSAVLNWFRTHENWLLVFDNADDISFLKNFLPPDPKGHILLTSRLRVFDTLDITKLVDMEEMSPEEAKSFLLKRTVRTNLNLSELEALEKLVHELGCLPLALEQAGAYIYTNNSSFKDYLVSYKIRGLKLLEKSAIDKSKYPESISTTWLMNFEEIKKNSEVSADFLFVSAFLNPNEIPSEIFYKGADELGPLISVAFADADTDPLIFDEVLNPLWQYSLINRGAGSHTYNIHRLVQAVLRDGMENNEQKLWAERVIKAVNHAFPEVEYKNWELCDKLLPHAQTCAGYINQWNLETKESRELLLDTGVYLSKRGRFKESELLIEKALEITEKTLGTEHSDVGNCLDILASIYVDLGKYKEAESLCIRAIRITEKSFGPEHPEVGICLNILASIYRFLGKYRESEHLHITSLKIVEQAFGSEHLNVGIFLNNLVTVYEDLGMYKEAEPLCIRSLKITENALGPEHPDVGFVLNNLGIIYRNLGKYTEAESLCIRALKITENALGPEHPDVGIRLNNLASVYSDLGKYSKAEPLYARALRVTENALGPEHPIVGIRLSNLASTYDKLGKHIEAESLFLRDLRITENALGSGHLDTFNCLKNLALLYHKQQKYSKAKTYYERMIEFMEKTKGENNLEFASLLECYAYLLNSIKRKREAIKISNRAKGIRSKIEKETKK